MKETEKGLPGVREKKGRRPFSYKIIKKIAVLSQGTSISKEVNVVQYADDTPRLDVRCWKRKNGEEQLLKGVSFTDEEAVALEAAVHRYNQENAAQGGER
ncbi:MAG: hypothetical protein IJP78_04195 [Clostridia bacterium]|nr:hypothetical protein [Clostridia bacterium]